MLVLVVLHVPEFDFAAAGERPRQTRAVGRAAAERVDLFAFGPHAAGRGDLGAGAAKEDRSETWSIGVAGCFQK